MSAMYVLGETVRGLRPTMYTRYEAAEAPPLDGTVCYIHPDRRFFVAEFHAAEGRRYREAFQILPEPEEAGQKDRGFHRMRAK